MNLRQIKRAAPVRSRLYVLGIAYCLGRCIDYVYAFGWTDGNSCGVDHMTAVGVEAFDAAKLAERERCAAELDHLASMRNPDDAAGSVVRSTIYAEAADRVRNPHLYGGVGCATGGIDPGQ